MSKKKKDWGKIGAMLVFLGFIIGTAKGIYDIPISETFTEAMKYFVFTLFLFLVFFIYFQFLKE